MEDYYGDITAVSRIFRCKLYPQSANNCQADNNIMVNVFGDRGASSDGQLGPRGPRSERRSWEEWYQ